ncbi:MAG: HD domain-containing phosphohydrolase [Myxococcota bacterium]
MNEKPASPKPEGRNAAHVQSMGKTLVGQLYMVLRTIRIHDTGNQTVMLATEHLKDTLNLVWGALGEVKLELVEDQAYLNDVRLRIDAQSQDNVKELGNEFRARGLGGLTFKRPVTTDGIRQLTRVFAQVSGDDGDAAGQMREKLLQLRDLAVEILGPRRFQAENQPQQDVAIDPRLWALQTYAKAVMAVKRFVQESSDDKAQETNDPRLKLTRIVQDLVDIGSQRVNLLLKLINIKDCTDYVYNHAVNVGVLSIAMGRALGLPRADLVDLGLSGITADLGFTQGLMDAMEKAHVDEKARESLHEHSIRAVRLLLGRGALTRASMRRIITAFEHHVHYDLKGGYPEQDSRRPLHLFSRIVQIADSFDALTTNRPWREAYSPGEALQMLRQDAGKKFDPVLLKVFINMLGIYPLGMTVRLSNGELAVVYHNPDNPELFDRPYVKVTHDPTGLAVSRSLIRDLSEQNPDGSFKHSILHAVEDAPVPA